jgi:protein-S-isoprenylcysteine O-methyltransferase Ste14
MNAIYLGVLWLIYYALHSAMATNGIKRFLATNFPTIADHYRALYSLFAFVNFILVGWFQWILPGTLAYSTTEVTAIIAIILGLGGAVIMVMALRGYPSMFWVSSASVVSENEDKLKTNGLNGIVRHPLYFGVLLCLIALVLAYPFWKNILFALITTIYIIIGSFLEEQKLIEQYGAAYIDYRHRVKMLIPFIV